MTGRFLACLLALALGACASEPERAPEPEVKNAVATVASGFRAGNKGLEYTVMYDIVKPFEVGILAVATFEDPAGGKPLRAERKVGARARRIALTSPRIFEIKNHKEYRVTLTLYREGRVVAVHKHTARFDVEEASVPMFIKRGITIH